MVKRILLVSSWSNSRRLQGWYLSPPMGLYRIRHWLTDRYQVEILDPDLTDPLAFLDRQEPYDLCGFSPTKDNMANDVALMRFVRRRWPRTELIIGGPEATFNYQRYLELGVVDMAVLGEGEKALAAHVAGAFGPGLAPSTIRSPLSAATVLTADELYRASAIDFTRFPAREYWARNRVVTGDDELTTNCISLYLTSFCPQGCKFCSSTRFIRNACPTGTGVIAIAPDRVVDLVRSVAAAIPETRTIYFHDDNACCYRDQTLAWCRRIAAEGPRFSFVASSRIDHFDPELLAAMKAAGFRKLSCGFEAYSDRLLRAIGKGQTVGEIDRFLTMVREVGLELHVNTMLCQPEATVDDVLRTAEFCLRLMESGRNTVIAEPFVKAYPGSWYHDHWELMEYRTVRSPALPGVSPETFRIPWRFQPRDPGVRRLLDRLDAALADPADLGSLAQRDYTKHQLTRALCRRLLEATAGAPPTGIASAPALSVIIPGLNEAATIVTVVDEVAAALTAAGVAWELILVNDGSSDRTGALMDRLASDRSGIRVIHHPVSRGVGASYRDGLAVARGDFVTWFPADGENHPPQLVRHFQALAEADVVAPYIENPEVRPFGRRLLSRLFQAVVKGTFRIPLRYTNGNAIIRRRLLNGVPLVTDGFLFQAELLVRAVRRGWSVREVPSRLAVRGGGRSKAISLAALRQTVRDYGRLLLIRD